MKRVLTVLALAAGLLAPALPGAAAPLAAPLAGAPRAAAPRSTAPAPRTTSVDDARRAAAVLRARVDALRARAEVATEAYDEAYAQLGAAVTAHLTAVRDVQRAQTAAGAGEAQRDQRVRALYMSGGTSSLYASVLDSTDLSEAFSRLHQVSVVLAGDSASSATADTSVAATRAAEARMAASADASTALQRRVAGQADTVRALLAQTDVLLAQADATVVRLAEQQRRAAEAAAAARAAAVLAAAQQAAAAALSAGGTLAEVGTAPGSTAGLAAVAFARTQLGKPYVWGATGPATYDCSGLTGAAWAAAGVRLPRTSRQQWYAGPHVGLADLAPGDLLFWASNPADPATIHHVAIYVGGGLMLAAPHTGDVVKVQPVYLDGYVGAVRPA